MAFPWKMVCAVVVALILGCVVAVQAQVVMPGQQNKGQVQTTPAQTKAEPAELPMSAMAAAPTENCVAINGATLSVVPMNPASGPAGVGAPAGSFGVYDGSSYLVNVKDRSLAELIAGVIKKYLFTRQCFVAKGTPHAMTYYKAGNTVPLQTGTDTCDDLSAHLFYIGDADNPQHVAQPPSRGGGTITSNGRVYQPVGPDTRSGPNYALENGPRGLVLRGQATPTLIHDFRSDLTGAQTAQSLVESQHMRMLCRVTAGGESWTYLLRNPHPAGPYN